METRKFADDPLNEGYYFILHVWFFVENGESLTGRRKEKSSESSNIFFFFVIGGLKTDNGERKRTPGGTFLYLMKNRGYVTKEQLKEIYKDEAERAKKFKREKRKKANKKSMENFEKRMVELQQMKNVNSEKWDEQRCWKEEKKKVIDTDVIIPSW